jgi:hypothetical protein
MTRARLNTRSPLIVLTFILALTACGDGSTHLETTSLEVVLTRTGSVRGLIDRGFDTDHLGIAPTTPLLTLGVAGSMLLPESATWSDVPRRLTLHYPGALTAEVGVSLHASYLTFELLAVSDPDTVEVAVWGPFPTDLAEVIGETIGVVRGGGYAIGIQALNIKTLGGYPWNADDHLPQLDAFEQDDPEDLSKGKRGVLYSVEAARPTREGSSLQAYCRNRSRARVIENLGRKQFVALPYDDGGVVGCKIALFGAPEVEVLATIGAIELAEGLPHPLLDGEWVKTNPRASAAYIILPFTEATFDEALVVTERAGLDYLYHPGPFATWGKFQLDAASFPNGVAGLRALSDRAAERGIRLGVHTLSNFITTNDPYVTPVPDPRLALVGRSALTDDITAGQRTIGIADPIFFVQTPDNLHAAVLGEEIIRFGGVSSEAPWQLLEVERGAYGTRASAHAAGDSIGKLLDHAYKVFLSDADLTVEMAQNLADLYNQARLRQISFDGLEGNGSTGLGNYGEALFTTTWFNGLDEEIKGHYIADASRPGHYFWHLYTRMNWGEPWYAGFRESQTEYRLKNQAYFQRNYMPGMLGWFNLTPTTSVEDTEWMLARSAAFDAGYAFNMSLGVIAQNGVADRILALLGEWERARFAGAFSQAQKLRMQDPAREFHLEAVGEDIWELAEVHVDRFEHRGLEKQPGEPTGSRLEVSNPGAEQPLAFLITARDGRVSGIGGEVDGIRAFAFDVVLEPGDVLGYHGGDVAQHYDANWRIKRTVPVDPAALVLAPGAHTLEIDGRVSGGDDAVMKIEVRLSGEAERIGARD